MKRYLVLAGYTYDYTGSFFPAPAGAGLLMAARQGALKAPASHF